MTADRRHWPSPYTHQIARISPPPKPRYASYALGFLAVVAVVLALGWLLP